jgi:quinol monooxygenase YgiN
MVYINIQHRVADFEKWRQVFDDNESFRREGGATGAKQIFRDIKDPNTITVLMEWKDVDQAQKFTSSPALAEAMKKAGVIGEPISRSFITRA